MVASPAVVAGGGAAIVVVLVIAIVARGRRRRVRQRKHEAHLEDLARTPPVEALPAPVPPMEALLVEADPPVLPRRHAASEPKPAPEPIAEPSPPAAAPVASPEPMTTCKADQLALHVAELAAQTAALTDAVMDLVARGAALAQPQTIVEPMRMSEPEPLAFAPIGAPLAEDVAPEPEPVEEPVPEPELARAGRRELMLQPPVRGALDEAFDWPSENELRAYSRTQSPSDDR